MPTLKRGSGTPEPILFTNGTPGSPTATGIVKASPGWLMSVMATNLNTSMRWLQFFDRTSALAGGETPLFKYPLLIGTGTVPTIEIFDIAFLGGGSGHAFTSGIVFGISTTLATYTAATASDHEITGYYL